MNVKLHQTSKQLLKLYKTEPNSRPPVQQKLLKSPQEVLLSFV